MTTLLSFILLSVLATSVSATQMTLQELTRKIEQKISGINELSYTYTLGYRSEGADPKETKPLIRAARSYKKPNLAREESVSLYMPDQPKQTRIYRLEGNQYNVYEISTDGSVKKTSHPAGEWEDSGVTRESLYAEIKKRMAHQASSIEYQANRDVYVLTFDAPDRATFEIYGESWSDYDLSWLPYSMTVLDTDKNVLVTTHWINIDVKADLPDQIFRLPNERKPR